MFKLTMPDQRIIDIGLEELKQAILRGEVNFETLVYNDQGQSQMAGELAVLKSTFLEKPANTPQTPAPSHNITSHTFSVDTHLFRELGELLVGRDSTALIELIKNSYDADATKVVVYGHALSKPDEGFITIIDDGVGMTAEQFQNGFLRVASRFKGEGESRSRRFGRRYTGAKGIGRLSAHKLARVIKIDSNPLTEQQTNQSISAEIDWDTIESLTTLEDIEGSGAISLSVSDNISNLHGTRLTLLKLRKRWTDREKNAFFAEVSNFSPPKSLITLPSILKERLLFDQPIIRDISATDPGFDINLTGELEVGEEHWPTLAASSDWVVEIDASQINNIKIGISPTKLTQDALPETKAITYNIPRDTSTSLFFQARILIKEGHKKNINATWANKASGIRVYMEGFRVLPYGETGNDWLNIDYDNSRRVKKLTYLSNISGIGDSRNDEALVALRNDSYFGAVLLTAGGAPSLRMLVNREGFIPDATFEELVRLVRIGIDLSTRVRGLARVPRSEARSESRKERIREETRKELRDQVAFSVQKAHEFASEARHLASLGDLDSAVALIERAANEFNTASETSDRLMTEGAILRILASVGAQMSGFVHEINGLIGVASAIETSFQDLSNDQSYDDKTRRKLVKMQQNVTELRRSIERQASYLVDVVSLDSRRRRSRQKLSERCQVALKLVESAISRKSVEVINNIPDELKSPPMFPAEIAVVFSNLLSNAVKATEVNGKINIIGIKKEDTTKIKIENTGIRVNLDEGERWFLPFESTTTQIDPILGQGMGMGLPITRNLLAEYGASIRFVAPSDGYSTAVEITFR